MIKSEVPWYLNIPSDPIPDVERFDPLVHLEIEVPKPEVPEDQKDPNEEDEMSKPFIRQRPVDLQKIWLRLEPTKNEFINQIENYFNEGKESLKSFERWSRHQELEKY